MKTPEADILFVTDSPDDAGRAVQTLQSEKVTDNIVIARDCEDAIDFIFCRGNYAERSFDHPPKLVLLDLKSSKTNEVEILRQVKADPRTKIIPVVILTSSNEERALVDGYNLGANSYVQKPVGFDEFSQTLKTLGLYWLVISQSPVANGKQAKGAVQP